MRRIAPKLVALGLAGALMLPAAAALGRTATAAQSPASAGPPVDASAPAPTTPAAGNPSTKTPAPRTEDPRYGLLTPIPETGVPPIYSKMYDLTAEELRFRAKTRDYSRHINRIRHKHFGNMRVQELRNEGIERLKEFTDPAAFRAMIDVLEREADDVRLAMLDHFATHGAEGQAALGWLAIYDHNLAIRNEALKRMIAPAGEPVKFLLNNALRTKDHDVICSAATVAGSLNVIEAIPLLIFAQAAVNNTGNAEERGDLAWIAIQTQRAYVQNLIPVVGSNSAAFQPVIGIVSEGIVMRVMDAVVIEYRTPVHGALVAMTTHDWGKPTEYLSYNVQAWWDWYNREYVPFKNEQAAKAEMANG